MHFSQFYQLFSRYPVDNPLVQQGRTQGFIKLYGRLVPIQYCPFQPSTTAIQCQSGQIGEQGFAVSFSPVFLMYIKVLQVDAWFA